jgi:hypothetical protein
MVSTSIRQMQTPRHAADKYSRHTNNRTIMPQLIETDDFDIGQAMAAARTERAEQRQHLTSSLTEIASEVTAALADAGLRIPVFFTVPSSGDALMTFATPMDPSDEDWIRACEIICPIVGNKIGMSNLYSRSLPCMAAGTPIGAADIFPAGGDPIDPHAPV